MTEHELDRLLRYVRGTASPADHQWVDAWLAEHPDHATFLQELERYGQDIALDQAAFEAPTQAWERLAREIDAQAPFTAPTPPPSPSRKRPRRVLAVLASGLFLLVVGTIAYRFWLADTTAPEHWIVKQTERGERSALQLPDGSRVYLNAESTLAYESHFGESERTVRLQGEAYFDVKPDPDRPFRVMTSRVQVQVLGTSFDVRAYPQAEEVTVAVTTGKVDVRDSLQQPLDQLLPGQRLAYMPATGQVRRDSVRADEVTAWQEGKLRLINTPLPELVQQLERWYDVDITLVQETPQPCRFTTTLDHLTLTQALDLLSLTTPLTYEQHGRTLTLRVGPCL
ncbi:ferric-dicitrate binding protein FerR, regulates iron transport through sigma-19 [Catalinimonas alkaloidigena]|uniref:Ferric-dicitrate binding protein FerR, regulates iron transport through sigma-19 n=1 Tax=Catalinimonas alkaloidigena TaxID=1075417 RepID=A0A1G9HJH6_9BACT|nr:FecR domain-containing protein [Catalinimonas alkaloidigena]SDL13022.1 ferric-dicitrate binding protein FerR, regulates iron transport through sigma-19 [Catalinimonas alkaloidigena]